VNAHRTALLDQLTRGADQLSETIASTTYFDMLENRRPAVHREIVTIGRQKGIEKVRLFNGQGVIMFSSDEAEIGRSLDKRAEACYGCHAAGQPLVRLTTRERTRIYRAPDGHRVLGMIRPIHNDASCWNAACHAHGPGESVLGVLDVDLSLAEADRRITGDQRRFALFAALAIAATSALLWWLSRRLILRPVRELIAGTRKVAEGDLHTTIPAGARHELGDVARAFNDMIRRLGDAQRQLAQADKLASVGRLAAGVAHEINNPLTGVLTYASLLEERFAGNAEVAADLEVIVRETKRCRDIVRRLLDFARPSPPHQGPTDLNEVVRRAVAVVMNPLTLNRVALDFQLAPALRAVPADANQIQQVVVNLLVNAAEAIGTGGGTIRIATAEVAVPPRGHTVVRAARCPAGCDLLDPTVRIGSHPAIAVAVRRRERDAVVRLDPVYGRFNHSASAPFEAGEPGAYACPHCRTRLELPGRRCEICGAPVFAVETGERGWIEWCTRQGCHWTRWEAEDARGPQPFAELVVEDTGCGIAGPELDHLFEPFFTTKGNRGLGLGLAVTWGIVEAHGGTIEVESDEGRGARFTVRLPFAREAWSAAAETRGAPAEAQPEPAAARKVGAA
jgi:two-component system NtrC family sensor kinase